LKIISFFALFIISFHLSAQVGVGTTTPEGALDIVSPSSGLLIPRVALNSSLDITTVLNPKGANLAEGTLVYNTGAGALTNKGFYFWDGSSWKNFIDNSQQVFVGKAIISGTGNITITGIPFVPKSITFTAYANVESYTLNSDNGIANNNNTIANSFGYMKGYARNYGAGIEQQVIYGGGSGSSLNDISRYASPSHCVGLRYSNNNGDSLGITSARLTSFNTNGFTLNVDSYADSIVIIFEATRY
jgi:hypothetical protein